jgi:hypothetical protein
MFPPRFALYQKMEDFKEHPVCVEFHFKLGTTAATYNMLKTAFGEATISKSNI